MTLKEIDSRIDKINLEIREYRKYLSKSTAEIQQLYQLREEKKLKSFCDFMQIGQVIKFKSIFGLSRHQVYIKKTGIGKSQFTNQMDFEIYKKNKKSFVLIRVEDKTYWNITLDSFFLSMVLDKDFEKSLDTFIHREENLDKIFQDLI